MKFAREKSLVHHLNKTLNQLRSWLKTGEADAVVLTILNNRTNEALEHWFFRIDTDSVELDSKSNKYLVKSKVGSDIRKLFLQIKRTISTMPILEEECRMKLNFVVTEETKAPSNWKDDDIDKIDNPEDLIKFDTLSAGENKVVGSVMYKKREDYEQMF